VRDDAERLSDTIWTTEDVGTVVVVVEVDDVVVVAVGGLEPV
jgi:hypothetical protein